MGITIPIDSTSNITNIGATNSTKTGISTGIGISIRVRVRLRLHT